MSKTADFEKLGNEFDVRVRPKASRNAIKLEYNEKGEAYLRVYVTEVPEKGKANKAVIKLLSKVLKIPKSNFVIVLGETSSTKRFVIKS